MGNSTGNAILVQVALSELARVNLACFVERVRGGKAENSVVRQHGDRGAVVKRVSADPLGRLECGNEVPKGVFLPFLHQLDQQVGLNPDIEYKRCGMVWSRPEREFVRCSEELTALFGSQQEKRGRLFFIKCRARRCQRLGKRL